MNWEEFKKNMSIKDTIINIFIIHANEELEIEDVCREFQDYYEIKDSQREMAYDQPKFYNEIRSIIAKLVETGEIKRLGRNRYIMEIEDDK